MGKQERFFFDVDADLQVMSGKTLAVIGYGNQGRSQALNMTDSGLNVIIGGQRDATLEQATEDGFDVMPVAEAAKRADAVFILVPDEIMPTVYEEQVAPHMLDNQMVIFASGYNVYYGLIVPAPSLDVVLLAPRMIGKGVRDRFVSGHGYPALIAVNQDGSGQAWPKLLSLAKGIGATKMGALESSFEEETILDLFNEQAMCGVQLWAFRTAFEILNSYGLNPSAILLELYASGEPEQIARAYTDLGIWDQLKLHSRTSQFGQLTRARLGAGPELRAHMTKIVEELRDGSFAREWASEQNVGFPGLHRMQALVAEHESYRAEKRLFEMMKNKTDKC
ncbi:MAG: ketol-acid reductoisomerase [Desulfofustis sp.]|nr:ketol-acid reductoisomerase [Desulfofustis sp.]